MVICFTVNEAARIAIDNLMNSGMYKDLSEAVCVSVVNHDIIQREAQHNGSLRITRGELLDDRSPFVQGSGIHASHAVESTPAKAESSRVPDIFRLPRVDITPDEFALAGDNVEANSLTSPKQWLFGQYNKLLPVKATLRALLNLSLQNKEGVPVADAVRTISNEALLLGDYLESLDARHGAAREDALATAFPTTSGSGSPGQNRFANQFVVAVNAAGTASGFPIALRLATYLDGKTQRINLSRQGAVFALLDNPVFDHSFDAGEEKFSVPEVSFLISHILKYVPEERVAITHVLRALSEGARTPSALDEFLSKNVGDRSMTAAFVSLQRSGVISRLIDLQLVQRVREGIRVNYVLTESGRDILADITVRSDGY